MLIRIQKYWKNHGFITVFLLAVAVGLWCGFDYFFFSPSDNDEQVASVITQPTEEESVATQNPTTETSQLAGATEAGAEAEKPSADNPTAVDDNATSPNSEAEAVGPLALEQQQQSQMPQMTTADQWTRMVTPTGGVCYVFYGPYVEGDYFNSIASAEGATATITSTNSTTNAKHATRNNHRHSGGGKCESTAVVVVAATPQGYWWEAPVPPPPPDSPPPSDGEDDE